jgi:hypothetical protein
MHQRLCRLAQQSHTTTDAKAWISRYTRKWEQYEQEQQGNRRPAKRVHPAIVALRTPEGKERIDRIREAKRMRSERDFWTKKGERERKELNCWLQDLNVPMPPEAWIDELLKQ